MITNESNIESKIESKTESNLDSKESELDLSSEIELYSQVELSSEHSPKAIVGKIRYYNHASMMSLVLLNAKKPAQKKETVADFLILMHDINIFIARTKFYEKYQNLEVFSGEERETIGRFFQN